MEVGNVAFGSLDSSAEAWSEIQAQARKNRRIGAGATESGN
jgi:hypothetical protein